jgi:CHAT domain-containing protein/tetratricopeptide (TPR) repeat protein
LFGALAAFGQQSQSNDNRELSAGQTLEREITGGETHRYSFKVQAREFFQLRVEQKGVDVELILSDAVGHVVATMDSPNGKLGPETVSFVAEQPGSFMLELSAPDAKAEKGGYSIKLEAPRPALPQDKKRVEVERLFSESLDQMNTKDANVRSDVIAKLESCVRGWDELQDRYMGALTTQQVERLQRIQRAANDEKERAKAVATSLPIPLAKTLTRSLSDEDYYHAYTVTLPTGGVLRISLRELGINVFVAIGKNEKPLKEPLIWSNFSSGFGRETATLIAPAAGEYVLLLSPVRGSLMRGSYEFSGEVSDSATDDDRKRVEAEKLFRESIPLSNQRTVESYNKLIISYERILSLWQSLNGVYFAAGVENSIGLTYYSLGDRNKALNYYQKALALWTSEGDKSGQGNALNNIANVYLVLQDKKQALNYYQQALTFLRESGDKLGEANTLTNIADVYSALGKKKEALELYHQVLSFRQVVRGGREVTTLINLGITYLSLAEYDKALENLYQGLMMARAFSNKVGEANALHTIGNVYYGLGDPKKALDFYQQALPLRRVIGNKAAETSTIVNIGAMYSQLGDAAKATDYLNQAMTIFKGMGRRGGQAVVLANLGILDLNAGNKQKALDHYRQAMAAGASENNLVREAETLDEITKAYQSLGGLRAAIFFGKEGVNNLQELRGKIENLDSGTQKSFTLRFQTIYQRLAEALIDDGQLVQALEIIGLYRDEQFYDFDPESRERSRRPLQSAREAAFGRRYHEAKEKIVRAMNELTEAKFHLGDRKPTEEESSRLSKLQKDLDNFSDEFVVVLGEATAEFSKPGDEQDVVPSAKEVTELQSALRDVSATTSKKAAAIYTVIGEDNLHTVLVTATGLKAFASPIGAAALNEKILKFYALLQSPEYDPRPLGKQLYDIILKPAEAELEKMHVQTILWELDGSLRYLPMAALSQDGKGYLVERYQNVVLTRSNAEQLKRATQANWTGAGFGSSLPHSIDLLNDGSRTAFPGLPGVLAELQAVFGKAPQSKGIIPGVVLIDNKFTKAGFYAVMKTRRPLIHISGHFIFRPGDSSRSFLILGDGTLLTLDELKREAHLFEGVDLLTLSACNTAATHPDANGREVDGFAELVQRMGATAVMATLWQVSDNSTPMLMREFYRNKQRGPGLTKAEALRQGQLTLLNGTGIVQSQRDVQKGVAESGLKLVVSSEADESSQQKRGPGHFDVVFVGKRDAPPFAHPKSRPFSHPYYWAPFILIGNWK